MLLDFKEIPQANTGGGQQDTFELFSRDFLESIGYKILEDPDRGADGKKDLIVLEEREGASGVTSIKWLVSCKHYAHSGKSVNDADEPNIRDRVERHNCDGFLGFYSTLPSVSLSGNIRGLSDKILTQTYDREKIEKKLLETPSGLRLANRFFPLSYRDYIEENPTPVRIYSDELILDCECCGKDLLTKKEGVIVLFREFYYKEDGNVNKIAPFSNAYISCKGVCDEKLKNQYLRENSNLIDKWDDLDSFFTPVGFINKVIGWLNDFKENPNLIEDEAYDKLKKVFLISFPFISRVQTTEEKENIKTHLKWGIYEHL